MQPVISFRGAAYRVGGKDVLHGLDLEIQSGETIVLLGRSGSGKTTTLKLVNALLAPTGGEVLVEGSATRDWDVIRLRRRIGYVIQESGLLPHFTVARNVGLVPELEGWAPLRIDARVDELLDRVGLPPSEFRARFPRQLSGGQKQRVGVARALAADPPILLFDEPFGALDPISRLELQREFHTLMKTLDKTCLFVTHDVREALGLASRVALLENGRVSVVASPRDFLKSQEAEARTFLAGLDWQLDP